MRSSVGTSGRFWALITLLWLAAAAAAPAHAQVEDKGASTGRLIVSTGPDRSSKVRELLIKVLGPAAAHKLSDSEVWTVSSSRLTHLSMRLRKLGAKIARLPEDWNHLFKRSEEPAESQASYNELIKLAKATPEFVGTATMRAQKTAVTEFALTVGADVPHPIDKKAPKKSAPRIVIPVKDGVDVTIQRVEVLVSPRGTSWRGIVEETGENALLMWWKDGRTSGVFAYKGHVYTIVNVGGDVHAVIESDPAKMPPEHAPLASDYAGKLQKRHASLALAVMKDETAPQPPKPFTDADRQALEAKQVTIDLMLLYTKKAASRYIKDPRDMLELAIEQANASFRNSGIGNVSARLVHAQRIDYEETGAHHFDHLYRMVDGEGVFKNVKKLRNEKKADIVGLIVEDSTGCGLSTRVGATAEEAFFVVHHSCATITISIAHEVGHILGARHDRSMDTVDIPFSYGHGYVSGTKWRDVMSYHNGCNGCPRIPFWSNPRVSYQGEPTGTATEDNARVVLEQAGRVAAFR